MSSMIRARDCSALLAIVLFPVFAACGDAPSTTEVAAQVLAVGAVSASDSQTAMVGSTLPTAIAVKVMDGNNQPVATANVTWAVLSGAGSLGATSSVTDAAGVATTTWTLGLTTGVQLVTATIANGKADTLAAVATAGAVQSLAVSSDPFVLITAGAVTAPLQVRAFDQYGNGVAGATVVWSTTAGTLGSATTATAANGVAQNLLQTSLTAGDHIVRATIGGFASSIIVRGQ